MNEGTFKDGHPRIVLQLIGDAEPFDVEFIVDTGFDGDISLPRSIAQRVVRSSTGFREHKFADGRRERFEIFETRLLWHDSERTVELLVLEGEPLLGTELLADYLLQVEVVEGGNVLIEPL